MSEQKAMQNGNQQGRLQRVRLGLENMGRNAKRTHVAIETVVTAFLRSLGTFFFFFLPVSWERFGIRSPNSQTSYNPGSISAPWYQEVATVIATLSLSMREQPLANGGRAGLCSQHVLGTPWQLRLPFRKGFEMLWAVVSHDWLDQLLC